MKPEENGAAEGQAALVHRLPVLSETPGRQTCASRSGGSVS